MEEAQSIQWKHIMRDYFPPGTSQAPHLNAKDNLIEGKIKEAAQNIQRVLLNWSILGFSWYDGQNNDS